MTLDPGTDARTIVTAAVLLPIVSWVALRLFRRWMTFTAHAIRAAVVEAMNGALDPRFEHMEAKFDSMADENKIAHSEVAGRLEGHDERLDSIDDWAESIDKRLGLLESRRRADRDTPGE